MAHQSLSRARQVAALLSLMGAACGPMAESAPRSPPSAAVAQDAGSMAAAPEFAENSWGSFHSQRFQLTVPLPEGKAWRIDDHREPELTARHEATSSRIIVAVFREDDLMNRSTCREAAKRRGLAADAGLSLVADEVTVGPEAYDTRVWIAVGAPSSVPKPRAGHASTDAGHGSLTGHVFAAGAFLRTCLFFHFSTEVHAEGSADEAVLSHRLAVARTKILGALRLDPPRTTWDADAPKEKP